MMLHDDKTKSKQDLSYTTSRNVDLDDKITMQCLVKAINQQDLVR